MRALSALLRLYPASFRAEYGNEMRAIHRALMREMSGLLGRATLWIDIVGDVIVSAAPALLGHSSAGPAIYRQNARSLAGRRTATR